MSVINEQPQQRWHPFTRTAFRFAFVYLLLYNLPFPLTAFPYVDKAAEWYSSFWTWIVPRLAKAVLNREVATVFNGSGDRTYDYLLVAVLLLMSLVVAVIWTFFDRKRPGYPTLYRWLNLYVRFALGSTRIDQDGAQSVYAKPPVFPAGDAGLVSTVDDYLMFARMLVNGGKHGNKQILRAESVREMTRDQITPEQKLASAKNFFPNFFDKQSWGYGLSIYTIPDAVSLVPGRYGWIGGFGTSFIVDPNRNLINIVMTQSTDFLFNGALDRFSSELYTATSV